MVCLFRYLLVHLDITLMLLKQPKPLWLAWKGMLWFLKFKSNYILIFSALLLTSPLHSLWLRWFNSSFLFVFFGRRSFGQSNVILTMKICNKRISKLVCLSHWLYTLKDGYSSISSQITSCFMPCASFILLPNKVVKYCCLLGCLKINLLESVLKLVPIINN